MELEFINKRRKREYNLIFNISGMASYKTLMRYATENFYEEEDEYKIKLGKKLLEMCIFRACLYGAQR